MVEAVLAVIRDVDVFPSVVVVVADAHTLAPSGRGQARSCGDVGEGAVVIVAIEMVGGSFSGGRAFEFGTVDQENVGPTVIVVVKDGDAGSSSFDDVLLRVEAAEYVLGGEAGFLGDVSEGSDG